MARILTKDATRPSQSRPGPDPRVEAACLKMMAKNPADRFESYRRPLKNSQPSCEIRQSQALVFGLLPFTS